MRREVLYGLIIGVLGATGAARGQHLDVSPYVSQGKILAGGFDDGASMFDPGPFGAFGWDFQEDPMDPYFIGDPGFNAIAGSGLPEGSRFGFRVLDDLLFWDGMGAVTFGAPPDLETIEFRFGSFSRTAGAGTGLLPDFFFGPDVGMDGTYHEHVNTTLFGNGGVESDPLDGIYAVQVQLLSDDMGVMASNPIWWVFNNGLEEQIHDLAIDHLVESTAIPLPAPVVLGVVSLSALGLVKRSRRRP